MFEYQESDSPFIANSDVMRRTTNTAKHIARVDSTVLIVGDSGVGKELMARYVHTQSSRSAHPFVAVNCGAISESLLESELFGHSKGSFTGASKDRLGYLETADGGTLFLDEIGEISLAMQVKLLRALQEREICRVGENITRPFNVRIIAATNRNLLDEVQTGRFRSDFYYRLRVIELQVPPLRERREDILLLARVFLKKFSKDLKPQITDFTPNAITQLLKYDWPGNVRELSNAVEYAVAMCRGECIDSFDLPSGTQSLKISGMSAESIVPLCDMERGYILEVLRLMRGNKLKTAMKLKISVATLYRKLRAYEQGFTGKDLNLSYAPESSEADFCQESYLAICNQLQSCQLK